MTVDHNKVSAQCRDAGMEFHLNSTGLKERVLFIGNLDVKAIMKVNFQELISIQNLCSGVCSTYIEN